MNPPFGGHPFRSNQGCIDPSEAGRDGSRSLTSLHVALHVDLGTLFCSAQYRFLLAKSDSSAGFHKGCSKGDVGMKLNWPPGGHQISVGIHVHQQLVRWFLYELHSHISFYHVKP